ncbi:sigma-70 family RNA polymerase sigma factor [Brevibacterium sp. JNUCC-42]|nr:sigma-70 family RNA polymerase sigma factor [Brevibacterium sp. JNUCC-42]
MKNEELDFWVIRLKNNDPEAFEKVYELTKTKVVKTVYCLIKNKDDLDDIVNEIYLNMWKYISTYDTNKSFILWLNGIVYNQVNNWKRKVWRRFRLFEKQCESNSLEIDSTFFDDSISLELKEHIDKLPIKLKSIIIYRYYLDFTYEQISEVLDLPLSTVKLRNKSALKKMFQYIDLSSEKVEPITLMK